MSEINDKNVEIDKNDNKEKNSGIVIKEIKVETERDIFENQLRAKFNKNDINIYFDVITENKVLGWINKLLESKLDIRDFSNVNDADILNEEYEDKKVCRIMRGDIDRTRVNESIYMKNFKEYTFKLIIYYIKQHKIAYKQGLNEVAGPFILLKYKLSISFTDIYTMLVCFIDKFLTNYFHETEFYSLKSSLCLINLLLKYHDPELFNLFEYSLINPELYATSWLLTIFANKCSLNVVYHLWDKIILFDDNLFPHFFIVSYLIKNRQKFFKVDCTMILSVLSQLRVDTIDEVDEILNFAAEIRDKTVNSFYLLANKLEIFNYGSKNLKKLYEEYKPNEMLVLPMFPTDIFTLTYKYIIGCPNENCENFLLTKKKFNYSKKCNFCNNRHIKLDLFYIIIDLRIFEDKNNEGPNEIFSDTYPGFLPKTITITKDKLNDVNFPKNILEEYKNDKEKNHFIIITSETNYFYEYEKKYYKNKERRGSKLGIFFKNEKILDINKTNELNKNTKKSALLKEFDNFKKLIKGLDNEKFKYVSYAYGGYKNIHFMAKKYNIELLEHKKNCILCKEEKNRRPSSFLFW